ncbi:MAG: hypothetical protein IJU99_03615 [Lachnospiraceae bacterium]|nr:hypothetical protein [Lachnospiraceae bacterium]
MKGMYERLYLNDHWGYRPHITKEMMKQECDWKKLTPVSIPHAPVILDVPLMGERDCHKICGYRKEFSVGRNYRGRHIFLHVTKPACRMQIFLNGEIIAEAVTGDPEIVIGIGDRLYYDQKNVLIVRADNEHASMAPFAGLCSEVYLEVRGEFFLASCEMEMGDDCVTRIRVNRAAEGLKVRQKLLETGRRPKVLAEAEVSGESVTLSFSCESFRRWDPTAPALYQIETELLLGGRRVDVISEMLGFARKEWKDGHFYLNGNRMRITAVDLPGVFPYLGYSVPGSVAAEDVSRVKKLSCFDAVISSGPCFTEEIYERCDEEGILCLTDDPRYGSHACAVVLPKARLQEALAAAAAAFDPDPAVALGRCLGGSEEISVCSWPLTESYPVRGRKYARPGICNIRREEAVPQELYLAQADGGLKAKLLMQETSQGFFEPVLYTNASRAEFFLGERSLGVWEADSSYAPGLNHAQIRIPQFRERMAGIFGRLNERMAKDLEDLLPALRSRGEAGLSRLDKVKLQMLMRRAKLSSEDIVSMTEGYYTDWSERAEEFSALIREDGEELRPVIRRRSFDHLSAEAGKTRFIPARGADYTEVCVSALDKDGELCERWQGDLSIESKGRVEVIPGPELKIRGGRTTFYVRSAGTKGEGEVRVRRPDVHRDPVILRFLIQE